MLFVHKAERARLAPYISQKFLLSTENDSIGNNYVLRSDHMIVHFQEYRILFLMVHVRSLYAL